MIWNSIELLTYAAWQEADARRLFAAPLARESSSLVAAFFEHMVLSALMWESQQVYALGWWDRWNQGVRCFCAFAAKSWNIFFQILSKMAPFWSWWTL